MRRTQSFVLSGLHWVMSADAGKKSRGVRVLHGGTRGSDSDNSGETNSLSAESGDLRAPLVQPTPINRKHRNSNRRRGSEWEVLEGLKDGQRFDRRPELFKGYLHKKRKWPLKGWHKRYFVVDGGILVYARSPGDISRGRLHGSVDIGLSVISAKAKRRRVDIDAEEFIYHLRAKTPECFQAWVNMLKTHRLYRQHFLTFGREPPSNQVPLEDDGRRQSLFYNGLIQDREGSTAPRPRGSLVAGTSGGRLASWIIESGTSLEGAAKEIGQAQLTLQQLSQLLMVLEAASGSQDGDINLEGASPNVKKDRRKFGLRKKKSGSSKGGSVDLSSAVLRVDTEPQGALSLTSLSLGAPPSPQATLSASAHSLAAPTSSLPLIFLSSYLTSNMFPVRPQSLPGAEHLSGPPSGPIGMTPDHHAREDFTILAKDIVSTLKGILSTLVTERDRLKVVIDMEPPASTANSQVTAQNTAMVATLRNTLNSALQQNSELKSRLARIHDASDMADVSSIGPASEIAVRPFHTSHSYSSSCVSASEFYDAEDLLSLDGQAETGDLPNAVGGGVIELEGDTSSEAGSLSSEEGSVSSDNSEPPTDLSLPSAGGPTLTGRRTRLPAARPDTEGLSLWNLLCKNIGKDLSQVSMPVTINEPLNMLQRLCEELEYSELLDNAASASDPIERMTLVAAFAVSAYGPTRHRAASKPFNPLLGETYECSREDRGFRFVAEQVSHHPPVSTCYAESKSFIFWQEARIRTKFWGKSMEFQPASTVHLTLPKTGDHYTWNKVTTCVHNLFGGQRWVDQYGELKITSDGLVCKLTFVKASYWSAKRHEVHGSITNSDGKVVRKLFGRWSEALFCGQPPSAKCIWRPGSMPEDFEMYYGFTSFAMELNELDPESAKFLPCTDTRFRPDQRALEEGNIEAAETLKLQLEQDQRDRKKLLEEETKHHIPKWFSKKMGDNGEECWQYNNKYWEVRKNCGFSSLPIDRLW